MPRPDIPGEEDDKWDIKVLGGNGGSRYDWGHVI